LTGTVTRPNWMAPRHMARGISFSLRSPGSSPPPATLVVAPWILRRERLRGHTLGLSLQGTHLPFWVGCPCRVCSATHWGGNPVLWWCCPSYRRNAHAPCRTGNRFRADDRRADGADGSRCPPRDELRRKVKRRPTGWRPSPHREGEARHSRHWFQCHRHRALRKWRRDRRTDPPRQVICRRWQGRGPGRPATWSRRGRCRHHLWRAAQRGSHVQRPNRLRRRRRLIRRLAPAGRR